MIEAINIHKSYGNLHVLKGVNLTVQTGEIISIMGASGAGKSTLLHILGTLDKPDSGTFLFNKQEPAKLKPTPLAAFRNANIGFVFQFHHLLPEFTALENVCIPGMIAGKNQNQLKKDALQLLDFLGLLERQDHKPGQLSGGEQQRVAVARALINRPMVVLADEPSGNLDTKNSRELHELFFKLRDEFKQTFVIATHNEELGAKADRKLWMADGIFTSPI